MSVLLAIHFYYHRFPEEFKEYKFLELHLNPFETKLTFPNSSSQCSLAKCTSRVMGLHLTFNPARGFSQSFQESHPFFPKQCLGPLNQCFLTDSSRPTCSWFGSLNMVNIVSPNGSLFFFKGRQLPQVKNYSS